MDLKLSGVLAGFTLGFACLVPILLYATKDWDWYQLAEEASQKKKSIMKRKDKKMRAASIMMIARKQNSKN